MVPTPKNTRAYEHDRRQKDAVGSNTLPYRQYGDVTVQGTGLTVVGDIYNGGSLSDLQRGSDESMKFGLCLGSAPQIDPTYFVGREAELEEMGNILQPEEPKQQRLVLGGIGGVGKTQLAIAYAERFRQRYDTVFWLNATSQQTLNADLRLVAGRILQASEMERLNEDQILTRVHEWLSKVNNTRWLLIFDNHDEPAQFDINKFCPYTAHGAVIVTTRLPDCVNLSSDKIRMQPLANIEESLDLLYKRSQREKTADDEDARRLVERLAGLPLALATAGAYLSKSPSMTFQQYLDAYEKYWDIDPRRPLELQEYRDRTLYTTWNLAYTRLEADDPEAAQLLKLLAYFDNQKIWYDLLSAGAPRKSSLRLRRSSRSPSRGHKSFRLLRELLSSQISFESAMSTLTRYCFVEAQNTTRSFSMHNCVHDWTLASLNKKSDKRLYWYAFDCVAATIDGADMGSTLASLKYAYLTPHAARLTHRRFVQDRLLHGIEPDRADNALDIAELLREQLQFTAAEHMGESILAQLEKALGPNHIKTVDTICELGRLYYCLGDLEQAEHMYKRGLARQEKILGPDHNASLRTMNNLGLVYDEAGRLEEAEQIYRRALARKERTLGPNAESTLVTVSNLGDLYRNQGKLEKAERMLTRALAMRRKVLGEDNVDTLDSKKDLASLYRDQGRLEKAEAMYRQALEGYRQQLGPQHPTTIRMIEKLDQLYLQQEQEKEVALIH